MHCACNEQCFCRTNRQEGKVVRHRLQHWYVCNGHGLHYCKANQFIYAAKLSFFVLKIKLSICSAGDLSAEQLNMWQGAMSGGCEQDRWKDLHMPQPNPFIPTVFDLKSSSSSSSEEAVLAVKKGLVLSSCDSSKYIKSCTLPSKNMFLLAC